MFNVIASRYDKDFETSNVNSLFVSVFEILRQVNKKKSFQELNVGQFLVILYLIFLALLIKIMKKTKRKRNFCFKVRLKLGRS